MAGTIAVVAACAPPPPPPPPPWTQSTHTTGAGYVSTDVGCAASREPADLEAFFRQRIGPVLGWDYQHVYPLGPDRWLWLFQDAFIDHPGTATGLDGVGFAHNAALVQSGTCFTLLHRGTAAQPASFERGAGEVVLSRWWWPLGGELEGGRLRVFWAEMVRDPVEPPAGDGLPWHPVRTWLATYDASDLTRVDFREAPGPSPSSPRSPVLYGYAVASDDSHTYLFGNTYQQNLSLDGGFWSGPHSATKMWLARVQKGQLDSPPRYWTGTGWVADPDQAKPIQERYWTENPMQPRYLDGRWVAVTKENGFWGDRVAVDVAQQPWGPWTTVQEDPVTGRGGDPLLNTYQAHALPWRATDGSLIVSLSQNARDMRRDAYPFPERYRPMILSFPFPDGSAAAIASSESSGTLIPERRENNR